MRHTTLTAAVAALVVLAASVNAQVVPVAGDYNRDRWGTAAPILPMENYVNKLPIPASGTVVMTCPEGTSQFYTASGGGADYEVRINGKGAACPVSSTTGTAGAPRPNVRAWLSGTTDITFCAVSGTTVYLACWAYLPE